VAVPEYARLNTGGSITRGNSGNGAPLTREIRAGREHKHGPNEALTVVAMRVNNPDRSLVGINRSDTAPTSFGFAQMAFLTSAYELK
jgi:hypothetical protein